MAGAVAGAAAPRSPRLLRYTAPVAVGLLGLAVWQLLVGVVGVSEFLLPSPGEIVSELRDNGSVIGDATLITGVNALVGLVLGTVVGVALAGLASLARVLDGMLAPVVAALAVVPIVALAPVLNSMFGADSEFGRRTIAAIAAFVPVFVNSRRGLRQSTPIQRDLMRVYAASGWQVFRTTTLPAAAPYVMTGLRVASSLAVISALVAEYFGGPRGGLGSVITSAAATSAYARSWAYVAAAIGLGLAAYLITLLLDVVVQRRLGAR